MSLERKYAWPKIKRVPVPVLNKVLFHARLGMPLCWVEGYHLAGDRQYTMRFQPIDDERCANPCKAGMHGGDCDVGGGGG